ncbi:MAG: 5-(carboxyamino)imidazole ribonucleotide synthase [Alphaproteobacteria bacterium]|nr:5-(carboxyamino)imidazole ribonucleotide synthase [Alphaproteobacteria bacterium]
MKSITLGILGGGQLGRMSALAAARLGIKTIIFTPEANSPASFVSFQTVTGDYSDHKKLDFFAGLVDVISYEFENIPVTTIEYLDNLKPVYPKKNLLEVAQDRIAEKKYLNDAGISTAQWAAPKNPDEVDENLRQWGQNDGILKTVRFGYDGKGQARISKDTATETIWKNFNNTPLILEEIIDFQCEISVIIARGQNGDIKSYGPMLNEHKNHILSRTIVPAPISSAIAKDALDMAAQLAEHLDLVGVLTLEMFITKDGRILANEIAPRTHNSGHWSIDACAVSQFENHVRAVCGLPLGDPKRHSDVEMLNIIGEDALRAPSYLTQDNACLHLYGKKDILPGRKMGHVTLLKPKTPEKPL